MPNWCSNTLTIYSEDTKQIAKFKRIASKKNKDNENTDLSLANFYPEPDKNDWYNWRINNWGTKWDVEATLEDADEDRLEYYFSSAWSPPTLWLETVSSQYPALEFRLKYEEEGNGFLGVAKAKAGNLDDQSIEY